MRKLASFMGLMLLILTTSIFTSCKPEPKPEPKVYTVTFDADGGSEVAAIKVKSGEKAVQPEDPTKEGYTFAGWMNGDAAYDWTKEVTANVELKASWEVIKYTITYLPEGIETDNPKEYTIESEEITLKDPTKAPDAAKPNFVQWRAEKEDGDVVTKIEKGSTGNKTFYAEYTEKTTYKVTLMNGDKAVVDVLSVIEGEKVNLSTEYAKYDLYSDKECKTEFDATKAITADTTIYVKVKTFTVTFDSDGGSEVKAITVNYGEVAEKPADPTKAGDVKFNGWYNGDNAYDWTTKVTSNLTLKAQWKALETYTVTFNSYGGSEVKDIPVKEGQKATKPENPTKKGHTFKYWIADIDADGTYTEFKWDEPVTDNVKLVAYWIKNEYKIDLRVWGIEENSCGMYNAKVLYGTEITQEFINKLLEKIVPSKEGYKFVGWEVEEKLPITIEGEGQILNITAQWEAEVVEPEYSSVVNVTKEDNVYSFADGTYQFIEENGNSILKFGMPEGTEFKAGDTIKITGTINFGEDTPYKQCFIQTLDKAGIAMFDWNMIQVADWDAGRLSGDVKVNKSSVIKDDYAPNYCKFQMNAPHDGEAAMYPIVTLKDVKITYIPYVAGAELDFWVAEDENGYDFGTGCDYAKGIKIDASKLQAGDILTFYYALGNVENEYGVYSQIKLGRGYDGTTLPGWTDAGANEWGQINVNGSSYSYELTEADITHIASESETGDYKLLMVFGHNVILSKITTK